MRTPCPNPDENLSVADAARARNCLHDAVHPFVVDRNFDLALRQEIDCVQRSSLQLNVTAFLAEAFDFGHRDPSKSQISKCLKHLISP